MNAPLIVPPALADRADRSAGGQHRRSRTPDPMSRCPDDAGREIAEDQAVVGDAIGLLVAAAGGIDSDSSGTPSWNRAFVIDVAGVAVADNLAELTLIADAWENVPRSCLPRSVTVPFFHSTANVVASPAPQ
jgi:hypothetical protein